MDAYLLAMLWHARSGALIGHLTRLFAWKDRVDERASVKKALSGESEIVKKHRAKIAAEAGVAA